MLCVESGSISSKQEEPDFSCVTGCKLLKGKIEILCLAYIGSKTNFYSIQSFAKIKL